MRFIQNIFWIVVFLVSTFCWVVLFEHGPSGFREGLKVEFEKLQALNPGKPVERKGDLSEGVQ